MWGHWLRRAKYILYICMDKDEYVKVGLAFFTELLIEKEVVLNAKKN